MKKILITESQAKLLVGLIQEERQLNEGWKDIILSVAMLAGVNLSGQNKIQAQNVLNNASTLKQVRSALQSDRFEKIVDDLEGVGMKNAEDKIYSNIDKIEKNLIDAESKLKINGDKLKIYKGKSEATKTSKNYKQLKDGLISGYGIKGISQDTIKSIGGKVAPNVDLVVSLDTSYNVSDLFSTNGYVLSIESKNDIKNILDEYKKDGLVIVGIKIISSTDKQSISPILKNKLEKYGYKYSNEGLSGIRNDQIKKVLLDLGIDTSLIKQNILFNQGSGTIDAVNPQDGSANYIRLYIDAIQIADKEPAGSIIRNEEDVIRYNFELAKIGQEYSSVKIPKFNFNIKPKSFKTNKVRIESCPSFN